MKLFALVAMGLAAGANFWAAGILQERYKNDKMYVGNLIGGLLVLGGLIYAALYK